MVEEKGYWQASESTYECVMVHATKSAAETVVYQTSKDASNSSHNYTYCHRCFVSPALTLLIFIHFVAHQSICRQEICCISIGCIGIAGENGAAEKYVCATWMHHHQLKCPNNNSLCAADSLSTRTDVSQFVSQYGAA